MGHRLPALAALLVTTVGAGCGTSAATSPTPRPTPVVPFPPKETALSSLSGAQHQIWAAYQVVTVPGRDAPGAIPSVPTVIDATGGAVPPTTAQAWGAALYRDAAWRRWGYLHAQAGFITHIDGPADNADAASRGIIVRYPDCALFPSRLALVAVPPDFSGTVTGSDQWEFVATYTAPAGASCTTVDAYPDGHTEMDAQFAGTQVLVEKGWLHDDALLGGIWVDDSRQACTYDCPTIPATTTAPASLFPAADTPLIQAPAAMRAVWTSYGVQLIPRQTVLYGVPAPPPVDNRTGSVVSDALAETWAQALFRDQAWLTWTEEKLQASFANHIGDQSLVNQDLNSDAVRAGGVPTLPGCAAYPTSLTLSIIGDADRTGPASSVAQHDEFVFDLGYRTPCSVSVTYPDGKHDTVTMPGRLRSYGSVREDPLLGLIWYPDSVVVPNG